MLFKKKTGSSVSLSVVIVAYQMQRELPRTVYSVASEYQDWSGVEGRVIVIDNGSIPKVQIEDLLTFAPQVPVHLTHVNVGPSPLSAINDVLRNESSDWYCIVLDGARLWSPRIIQRFLESALKYQDTPNGPLAWHLGPVHQSRASEVGYNQETEDNILKEIDWQADGYRLFDVACLAGANPNGFYGTLNESTALFVTARHWRMLGGFNQGFVSSGGGYGCLDLFSRLLQLTGRNFVVHLGEGTFHQFHGGASTSSMAIHSQWQDEYLLVVGTEYEMPNVEVRYVGSINESASRFQ